MLSGMQGLKLFLAPKFWRFFETTLRLETYPEDPTSQPVIFASLHRDLIPAIMYVKPTKLAIVVSNSPDGDILVHALGDKNYNFVRGASGKDGGRAFVGMRRMLDSGISVGVAVDGPDGPFGKIHDGALHLARKTGFPIVPIKACPSRAIVLRSWDRTIIPLPFSSVGMVCGSPIFIPQDSQEFGTPRKILEEFFRPGEDQS